MKQTPCMAHIQEQMRPGVITQSGFLGTDSRSLPEILEADDATVRRMGVTHAQIAARMRTLRDAGVKSLGLATAVAPHFEVQVDDIRGVLPCPFLHSGMSAKTTTTVANTAIRRSVVYSDLSIHLIEEHGFYEGIDADFRLDPEALAAVLEIEPVSARPGGAARD
jgi:hypothetical protein